MDTCFFTNFFKGSGKANIDSETPKTTKLYKLYLARVKAEKKVLAMVCTPMPSVST